MSSGRPTQDPDRLPDPKRVRALAAGLVALAEGMAPGELESLGIAKADIDEVRRIATSDRRLPTARELALAAMSGDLPKEMVLTGYARGQRGIHALAPIVVLRIAAKVDDDQAPGSTRLLIELAKGLGLFTPAEPIAPVNRAALLDLDAERQKPLEVLKAELLQHSA